MIIDSSVVLAILLQEPEAERIARAIALNTIRLMSAATLLEISMAVFLRVGEQGLHLLDLLIAKYGIEVVPMTAKQSEIARRAFTQYGKGIHPARLNFGDCIVYALAKDTGEPCCSKAKILARLILRPLSIE